MMLALVFVLALVGIANSQLIPNSALNSITQGLQVNPSDDTVPLKVEVLLLHFNNPLGIVYSGKKCDFFAWGCDIKAYGYVDLVKAYDEWPGQREMGNGDFFWYEGENSSPRFNKMWTVTVCNPSAFTAGNLRVHMMDVDGGLRGGDDFINNFNCIFTKPSVISSNRESSSFTNELTCDAMYSQPQMALFFKYRVYRDPSAANCPSKRN